MLARTLPVNTTEPFRRQMQLQPVVLVTATSNCPASKCLEKGPTNFGVPGSVWSEWQPPIRVTTGQPAHNTTTCSFDGKNKVELTIIQ
mmetsp:Transcript_72949/g.128527  ORF Transcript_72949/g.128527 Transcript_72949/m.128527 type:complete len:88 (+) Transcript_72949:235-498(+)